MLQILARRDKGRSLTSRLRTRLTDLDRQTRPVIDVAVRSRSRMGLFGWSFVVCVLVPSIIATVYFCFIESNEYVSEAKFTVRTASQNESGLITDTNSPVAPMGMGLGSRTTSQDIFIVADYIR